MEVVEDVPTQDVQVGGPRIGKGGKRTAEASDTAVGGSELQRRRQDEGDAKREAAAVRDRLRSHGLVAGQAVAVQLPNGPEAVIAMFGTWLAGGVFVPLNVRQTEGEVDAPSLITAKVGLDGVKAAFEELASPEKHTKILVEPWR